MKEVIIKYLGDKIESHEIVEEVGELIRCKNCVKSQYDFMTKGYWCDGKQVSEHHYCGYAERKSDDD